MAKRCVSHCVAGLMVLLLVLSLIGCDTENPVLQYYSVIFYRNGSTQGTVPVFSITVPVGSTVTVPDNTGLLQKDYHVFIGWNTEADGTGNLFDGGDEFAMPAGNVVLYAAWERVYHIGQNGPAGGIIFYDKGTRSDGWQYLEAAPAGWNGTVSDPVYVFGYYRETPESDIQPVGTVAAIGSGEVNTQALVGRMGLNAYTTSSDPTTTAFYAANICTNYHGGGYYDWFLPAKDELDLMYQNLHAKNIGNFSADYYWCSSEYDHTSTWTQLFSSGGVFWNPRVLGSRIRPVRSF